MKKRIISYVLLIVLIFSFMIQPISASEEQITMYALDGRTISVSKADEEAYKNVGWYSFPPTIVYAADGRQQVINKNDLNAWLAVGWYSEPMATVYAADGRSLVIPSSQIEAYKAVGWYYTITMYAPDGRTAEVPYPDVQAWINVGWFTEPVKIQYSEYNGYYYGGGVLFPGETYRIGEWSAYITKATSDTIHLFFSQSESDYYIEDMILYRQQNGSYYGVGYSTWGRSYITVWLESPQCIVLTVSGAADCTGTEYLYKE